MFWSGTVSSQILSRRWFISRDKSLSDDRKDNSLNISKSPTVNSFFCFDPHFLLVDGKLLSVFAFRRRMSCPSHELDGFVDEEGSEPSLDFEVLILMLR